MIEVKKNNFLYDAKVNTCLESIIKNKSFANGYIFYGAEGVGKKQTALKFIKDIFKESSPFGNIEEKITKNNHPDFLLIEPSSLMEAQRSKTADLKKTTKSESEIIKVDKIRNIKTFLGQKSINSEKKIVLIIDAHLLNEAASNCLLKTLEEPNNGIFILLTSKLNLLLDTVISRCQLFKFRSFSRQRINTILEDYLNTYQFNISRKLKIEDFKLVNAPGVIKLLSLADLGGLADLAEGEGLSFDLLEINMQKTKDLLELNEILALGPSMSVLMQGYQSDDGLTSLRGTLVPAKTLNKIISKIPLIGNIVIPKEVGEGLFGVSFKMKGTKGKIKTTINPIRTLTPRFLQKIIDKNKEAK